MKTILFKYKIEKVLISLLLFFISCHQEINRPDYPTGAEIEASFLLSTDNMEELAVSNNTRTISDDLLEITYGKSATITRAATSLTPEQESAIKTISYFEFNGTDGGSRCVKKGTTTKGANDIANLRLTASQTTHTIYVVANMGDVTTGVTADESGATGTTITQFQALTFAYTNDLNVATNGLPMMGSVQMIPTDMQATIPLTRMVAKMHFTFKTLLPTGDSFTFTSMQLKNVATIGRYTTQSSYPNPAAANFADYTSVNTTNQYWYIPENRRGIPSGNSEPGKNALAPAYSTCVEISGKYTVAGSTYGVVYTIYLGGNATNNFEILRNTVYNISLTIKGFDKNDARMRII